MSDIVRFGIIGVGAVSDYHHLPGIRLDPRAELVAIRDPNEELMQQRQADWGPTTMTPDYEELAADPDRRLVRILDHLGCASTARDSHVVVTCYARMSGNVVERMRNVR